jgi:transcriptional regulator with XRE-family HTH domain
MENSTLGSRVGKFRDIKRLTVEELAERSGLDLDFIQEIESGKVMPPLGALLKLSRAMGIRMANFLDDKVSVDPIVVKTAERVAEEGSVLSSGRGVPQSLVFHHLGKGKIDRHMEPFFIEVLPQPPGSVKVSQHEGEELIVVVSGAIELQYGKDTYTLETGDSAYYSSNVQHRLVAINDEKAEILAVIHFNV